MLGRRADHVDQLHPLLLERLGHDVGGLLLVVDLAAVGDGRTLEQVRRHVGAVVKVPEPLLVPRRCERFLLEDPQELGRLGEAGSGRGGGPQAGVVDGVLPARRPAHRKAAGDDAVLVDRIVLLDLLHRLEGVHLAGEAVGVAVAAVEVDHDRIGWHELAFLFQPLIKEAQFA